MSPLVLSHNFEFRESTTKQIQRRWSTTSLVIKSMSALGSTSPLGPFIA
jgi:hypothetical protein